MGAFAQFLRNLVIMVRQSAQAHPSKRLANPIADLSLVTLLDTHQTNGTHQGGVVFAGYGERNQNTQNSQNTPL